MPPQCSVTTQILQNKALIVTWNSCIILNQERHWNMKELIVWFQEKKHRMRMFPEYNQMKLPGQVMRTISERNNCFVMHKPYDGPYFLRLMAWTTIPSTIFFFTSFHSLQYSYSLSGIYSTIQKTKPVHDYRLGKNTNSKFNSWLPPICQKWCKHFIAPLLPPHTEIGFFPKLNYPVTSISIEKENEGQATCRIEGIFSPILSGDVILIRAYYRYHPASAYNYYAIDYWNGIG